MLTPQWYCWRPCQRSGVDPLAGEGGHEPLKRGRSLQAIALGSETAGSNGDQVSRVAALAMKRGKSVDFTGYWQRHIATT